MLIDLVPSFLEATSAPNPVDGYRRYFEEHHPVLSSYWRNYVLDPDSSPAEEVIRRAVKARRGDLYALLESVDVKKIAADALARCEDLFRVDRPVDLYLMVGVGGANAGELVVAGRGIAFICLEHFTARPNPETNGLGLSPDLIPLWIGHVVAHTVRYTSPASKSEFVQIIAEDGGAYDYWQSGSRATLQEMLINEGLAVAASHATAPGFEPRQYFRYGSRQYRRLRELEAFLRRAIIEELHHTGIGYRLRYFAGGTSVSARRLAGRTLPERAGYYLGHRMVESYVTQHGIAEALRASAEECLAADRETMEAQTA
jgi:hypothetical protein